MGFFTDFLTALRGRDGQGQQGQRQAPRQAQAAQGQTALGTIPKDERRRSGLGQPQSVFPTLDNKGLVYVGDGGRAQSDPGLTYDPDTETLTIPAGAIALAALDTDVATQAELDGHAGLSPSGAHGNIQNSDVDANAAIAYSKLDLAGSVQVSDLAYNPATQSELDNHTGDTANPHGVTASQVGAPSQTELDNHTADGNAHHSRYTNAEARSAVIEADVAIDGGQPIAQLMRIPTNATQENQAGWVQMTVGGDTVYLPYWT